MNFVRKLINLYIYGNCKIIFGSSLCPHHGKKIYFLKQKSHGVSVTASLLLSFFSRINNEAILGLIWLSNNFLSLVRKCMNISRLFLNYDNNTFSTFFHFAN